MKSIEKLITKLENAVWNPELSWDQRYHIVFSSQISLPIIKRFHETGINLDWYDPDSSYEEDVLAFYYAVKNKEKLILKFEQ